LNCLKDKSESITKEVSVLKLNADDVEEVEVLESAESAQRQVAKGAVVMTERQIMDAFRQYPVFLLSLSLA